MDKLDYIKSMLQNFINDETEKAKEDCRKFITLKSQEIAGITSNDSTPSAAAANEPSNDDPGVSDDDPQIDDPASEIDDRVSANAE